MQLGKVSDGYHTFDELYEHRRALFRLLTHLLPDNAWKARYHDDGTMYDGFFIVGLECQGKQITYHEPVQFWASFKVRELARAPEYDGHTPKDVVKRLEEMATVVWQMTK